ncbi:MAG: carbohydrate kinase family protein [Candidatus Curtissbacteria bacterium]|nr:carbohydrate kinase family protein [Candidatus Curtissbacteria bacterium]
MADIVGIGSAYTDYFFETNNDFLKSINLNPEDDFLFSEKKITREEILKHLKPTTKSPGGIAPNTLSALYTLKTKSAYLGVIGKDEDGDYWIKNINLEKTKILRAGKTPMCPCILTRVGKQRTFLSEENKHERDFFSSLDYNFINKAKIVHITPLVVDVEKGINKTLDFLESVKGPMISFNPSGFYIQRAKTKIKPIIKKSDIIFLNEHELKKLTGKPPRAGSNYLLKFGPKIVVCTLSKKGALITTNKKQFLTGRHKVNNIVDTTGAGDTFAAGFL